MSDQPVGGWWQIRQPPEAFTSKPAWADRGETEDAKQVTGHDGCAAYCDSANDLPCRCCRLTARAEAAEAERDALRETVKTAAAMLKHGVSRSHVRAYLVRADQS